jgi:hypothetical protein
MPARILTRMVNFFGAMPAPGIVRIGTGCEVADRSGAGRGVAAVKNRQIMIELHN